jgi:hypothetical protein
MLSTSNTTKIEKAFRIQKKKLVRVWLPKASLGLFFFFIFLGSAWPSPLLADPPSTLSFSMHNQQFSAHIIRVPLEKVFSTLTAYVPLRFFINGNAKNELISASFSNLTLQKTLEQLLTGYDYAIMTHRLETTTQVSEFDYRTEVEIISRNPTKLLSNANGPGFIPSRKTSVQPTLVKNRQISEIPSQEKPFDLETGNDASDLQATLKEALQEDDQGNSALLTDILEKLDTARD